MSFTLGSRTPTAPVVLAPMAGVTNAPFRALCRRYAPGLVYVNEMVMATAVVHGNAKTRHLMHFDEDEPVRSLQLYGSDPLMLGRAVHNLCDAGKVDHIDLNFGCPAQKVTRKGGGAAVPLKKNLLRAILKAAVSSAAPYGVPVTCKFRMGINDDLLTYLDTGRIAAEEGVAAIALHARTAQQHYAGEANWDAIGELKQAVQTVPVLGNGDIWEASDAMAMVAHSGCDGVVIGRGCLGRPWLFADLVAAFNGEPIPESRTLGEVVDAMLEHAKMLCEHKNDYERGVIEFRKHASWYLTGYPVGPDVRRRAAQASSLGELEEILVPLERELKLVEGGARFKRGHTNGPIKVVLPEGYLDHLDDMTLPDDNDVAALSGG